MKKISKNYMACSRGLGDHKKVSEKYFKKRSPAPNLAPMGQLANWGPTWG
jgi:hypothetical protein